MGYNTAAIILNDGLDQIAKDKDLGKRIHDSVLMAPRKGYTTIPAGNHCNPMTVLPSAHADMTQIIVIHGNCIRRAAVGYCGVGYRDDTGKLYPDDSQELGVETLKALAHHLGYSMRKIR
jgi:hypothetical protein